ncbi:MAG: HesA/MoeB/ThiF family protein [Candidatus Odinarchaeota archaeon]|nr:HesA/MoeB/ThiF family protein [Candidatus Odinarchaeota archaeon]
MINNKLSEDEKVRYSRQLMIFGEEAQVKLKKVSVAVIGIGGLGSPVSLYLAAAGVGHLILIDSETPELSNLNRQVLHWESDIDKRPKAESAKEKLLKLNSRIKIMTYNERLTRSNIDKILSEADIIVDALDNFETRYLVNEYCVQKRKPLIHAAVEKMFGQITTIIPGETPCLKCIIPETPPFRGAFPILGTTAGILGILEANEVIKLVTGIGEPLKGKMLFVDIENNDFSIISLKRSKKCPVCSSLF